MKDEMKKSKKEEDVEMAGHPKDEPPKKEEEEDDEELFKSKLTLIHHFLQEVTIASCATRKELKEKQLNQNAERLVRSIMTNSLARFCQDCLDWFQRVGEIKGCPTCRDKEKFGLFSIGGKPQYPDCDE